jgi:hypothetical protein
MWESKSVTMDEGDQFDEENKCIYEAANQDNVINKLE